MARGNGKRSGSSPLARGLQGARLAAVSGLGIIPARAGFTSGRRCWCQRRWDHPRSRGVYAMDLADALGVPGSSPLARGLPLFLPWILRSRRIIPARAGFTEESKRGVNGRGDHPRSRGVYVSPIRKGRGVQGSSPLARGLRQARRQARADARIIPARAGFTSTSAAATARARDHPRSRGVYVHLVCSHVRSGGSSPLARGLPTGTQQGPPHVRIIPARAGFT